MAPPAKAPTGVGLTFVLLLPVTNIFGRSLTQSKTAFEFARVLHLNSFKRPIQTAIQRLE